MPKLKTAVIKLYEAYETWGSGIEIKIGIGQRPPTKEVEYTTFPELAEKVKAFADFWTDPIVGGSNGAGCYASVDVPRGTRKPPGFDKATDAMRYHNLKPKPERKAVA